MAAVSSSASSSSPSPSSSPINTVALHGFGTTEVTSFYEIGRPSYPVSQIDTALEKTVLRSFVSSASSPSFVAPCSASAPFRIIDLGAGTGKSTALLLSRLEHFRTVYPAFAFELIAVEPVEAMRERFGSVLPQIKIVEGCSTLLPFPDGSIDLIFAGQAFHWFANKPSMVELARVLRTDGEEEEEVEEGGEKSKKKGKGHGFYSWIWNNRAKDSEYATEIEQIIDDIHAEYKKRGETVPRQQSGEWKKVFEEEEVASLFVLPYSSRSVEREVIQKGDLNMIISRCLSISVVSERTEEEKQQIKEKIKEILLRHTGSLDGPFQLVYDTDLYWVQRK